MDTFNLAWAAEHESNLNDRPKCQEKGCDASSIQCEIPGGIDFETNKEYAETYEYYCPDHAAEHGFCCCCGMFIAGWRDFSDMCENCEDQTKANERDYEDDDPYYEDDDPYYWEDPF